MKLFLKQTIVLLKRHARESELKLIGLSVFFVIFSMVFTTLFYGRLSHALLAQGLSLLGSDRTIISESILDQRLTKQAEYWGLRTTTSISFKTMLEHGESFVLSEVRAVTTPYPLLGFLSVLTAANTSEHSGLLPIQTSEAPRLGEIWIEQPLLTHLNLSINDSIRVGQAVFKISGVLVSEPSKMINLVNFAPLILMNQADIPKTGLLDPKKSEVTYHLLLVGSKQRLLSFDRWLKAEKVLKSTDTYLSAADSIPFVSRVLLKIERYLWVVLIINLFLSIMIVMRSTYHFGLKHLKTMAIIKTFGGNIRSVAWSYIGLLFTILGGSTLTAVSVGFLFELSLKQLLFNQSMVVAYSNDTLKFSIVYSCLITALLTMVCAILFLRRFNQINPILLLRKEQHAFIGKRNDLGALLRNFALKKIGFSVLHKMCCRSAENIFQILILSVVFGFVGGVFYIKADFLRDWDSRLSFEVPNYFVLNITPSLLKPFKDFLAREHQKEQPFYPLMIARLLKVNDKMVSMEPLPDSGQLNWPRLLYLSSMPTTTLKSDNTIVEGRWFSDADTGKPVASVEAGFAKRLGIRLGDFLEWSFNDRVMKVQVISIRSIQWDTFEPNFLILVPNGLFGHESSCYLTPLLIKNNQSDFLNQLLKNFPMVSLIDIHMSVSQIRTFVQQASALLKIVLILTSSISFILCFLLLLCSSRQRIRELEILKKLGLTRGESCQRLCYEAGFMLLCIIPLGFCIAQWIRLQFAQQLIDFL